MWERFEVARKSARPWCGDGRGVLRLADWSFRLEGLDDETLALLAKRWGPFWQADAGGDLGVESAEPTLTLSLLQDGEGGWLEAPTPGELYRIELRGQGETLLVVSYHFALAAQAPGRWHAVISQDAQEPPERIIENMLRYLVSRHTVEQGGVPLHSAAVLDGSAAQIFVGPSRSGKSTAVRLTGAPSLGDDFGLVLPEGDGWKTCAVPFDNSERVVERHEASWVPVEGIWRLFQAETAKVDYPVSMLASVSLMTGVAFPWVFRDLSDTLLASVDQLAGSGRYGHLHFAKDSSFWELIRVAGD